MALNATRGWLISYDISHPKRLNRAHRLLVKHATPLQYSVFCFEGNATQLGRLMKRIQEIIDKTMDDVRAYPLPENLLVDILGKRHLPDGVALFPRSAALQKLFAAERSGGASARQPADAPTTRKLAACPERGRFPL